MQRFYIKLLILYQSAAIRIYVTKGGTKIRDIESRILVLAAHLKRASYETRFKITAAFGGKGQYFGIRRNTDRAASKLNLQYPQNRSIHLKRFVSYRFAPILKNLV